MIAGSDGVEAMLELSVLTSEVLNLCNRRVVLSLDMVNVFLKPFLWEAKRGQ